MKKIIPFGVWPGSWGLKGRTRECAQAEYYLQGRELELRLMEIMETDPQVQARRRLEIDHAHGLITITERDLGIAALTHRNDASKLALAQLEIEFRDHVIETPEYQRRLADIQGEPWVAMPEISWDPADPSRSFFKLDYNDHFVAFLRKNGYSGTSEDVVVEAWLNDVCRSVIQDLGQEDPAFLSAAAPLPRRPHKTDGTSEYS